MRNYIYSLLFEKSNREGNDYLQPPLERSHNVSLLLGHSKPAESLVTPSKPLYSSAILATNRKIHDEAACFLVGSREFYVTVKNDSDRSTLTHLNALAALPVFNYISKLVIHVSYDQKETYDTPESLQYYLRRLCEMLARNKLTEITIYYCHKTAAPYTLRDELHRHAEAILNNLKGLRNVQRVWFIHSCFLSPSNMHKHDYLSSDYEAELRSAMEGP